MNGWKSLAIHDARVGAISLLFIGLTAACFPLVRLLTSWGLSLSAVLLVICGFTFTPAVTCSVYSIAKEHSKLFGMAGLVIAPVAVLVQPETLYFVEMGLGLVPCTLIVMMIIAKRRARTRREMAT